MELLLRTLSPVAVGDYAFVNTEGFFDIQDNTPRFQFRQIEVSEGHEHVDTEFILRSKLGNWLFWHQPHVYSLVPKDMSLTIPLLALLEPENKQFEASFTGLELYELIVFGSSAEQWRKVMFVALRPGTDFRLRVQNFSSDICQKISKIAHIQLNQLKNLAVLLGFEHNDRLISSLNFLLENTPDAREGCLMHWTFSHLQELLLMHVDLEGVIFFTKRLTRDFGLELMPINWVVVERV